MLVVRQSGFGFERLVGHQESVLKREKHGREQQGKQENLLHTAAFVTNLMALFYRNNRKRSCPLHTDEEKQAFFQRCDATKALMRS
jgi:hypothetical protein